MNLDPMIFFTSLDKCVCVFIYTSGFQYCFKKWFSFVCREAEHFETYSSIYNRIQRNLQQILESPQMILSVAKVRTSLWLSLNLKRQTSFDGSATSWLSPVPALLRIVQWKRQLMQAAMNCSYRMLFFFFIIVLVLVFPLVGKCKYKNTFIYY